jgi:hypothetical protein
VGFGFLGQQSTAAPKYERTGGEVANAAACKAVIHGFKSHSVLQIFCVME